MPTLGSTNMLKNSTLKRMVLCLILAILLSLLWIGATWRSHFRKFQQTERKFSHVKHLLQESAEDDERNGEFVALETTISKNFFYSAYYDNRLSLGRAQQVKKCKVVQLKYMKFR